MLENDKIRQYTNYVLIGIVSFVALVILPFVGGVEGGFCLPQSKPEWVIWVINRIIVSVINIMLFYCFMEQGHINSEKNENYLKAVEILQKNKDKHAKEPVSPTKWQVHEYSHKLLMLVISTLTASVALTQMILKFDLAAFVSYFLVILGGLIFGVLQMKKAEQYWTEEFLEYAKKVEKENKEAAEREQEAQEKIEEAARKAEEEQAKLAQEAIDKKATEEVIPDPKPEQQKEELPSYVLPEDTTWDDIEKLI